MLVVVANLVAPSSFSSVVSLLEARAEEETKVEAEEDSTVSVAVSDPLGYGEGTVGSSVGRDIVVTSNWVSC